MNVGGLVQEGRPQEIVLQSLVELETVSNRIIKARYCKLAILQCFAPTNEAEDEVKTTGTNSCNTKYKVP